MKPKNVTYSRHSLLAARLLGKLREHYPVEINMQDLFNYPTVEKLSEFMDNGGEKSQESST